MQLVLIIALFIYFLSGFLFVHRMLALFQNRRILTTNALTKIGTPLCALIIAAATLAPVRVAVIIIACLLALLWLLQPLMSWFREAQFKRTSLAVVDDIVLNMKTGRAFRHAYEDAQRRSDAFTQQKLIEIMSLVAFSQQKPCSTVMSNYVKLLVEEFIQVDMKPHRAIQRLEVLRARLKLESNFRRKSGQAVKQVRMQAMVLLVLYCGLLFGVSRQVDISHYVTLVLISLFLMISGYGLMWWLVRSFVWKV